MKQLYVLLFLLGFVCGCAESNSIVPNTPEDPIDTPVSETHGMAVAAPMNVFDRNTEYARLEMTWGGSGIIGYNKDTILWLRAGRICTSFVEDRKEIVLPYCGKTGCSHSDETCSAYFGSSQYTGFLNDCAYGYFDDPEGFHVSELNLITGKRETIASWKNTDTHEILFNDGIVGKDYLVISYEKRGCKKGYENDSASFVETVDLRSKERRIVLDSRAPEHFSTSFSLVGIYANRLVYTASEFSGTPIPYPEWLGDAPDDEEHFVSYVHYYNEFVDRILCVLDLGSMKTETITRRSEGFCDYCDSFPKLIGRYLVLVEKEDLSLYDVSSGSKIFLTTVPGISNYSMYGDHIVLIGRENGALRWRLLRLSTGEMFTIPTDPSAPAVPFTIFLESSGGFVGNDYRNKEDGQGWDRNWVSYEDFINGRLDQGIPFN